MCLILFSWKDHPNYDLVIAANRDEFYKRKTRKAKFWDEKPDILAGKDLEAGGTWMGISRSGRISMLTNFRDLQNLKKNAPSRGKLVLNFLEGKEDPEDFLNDLEKKGNRYNGYNIIAGTLDGLWYQSNYSEGVRKIEPGLHGLSNGLIDEPWPKVNSGKKRLAEIISSEEVNPDDLLDILYDDHIFPDSELPDTGVGLERERMLSSMFIKSPVYGSRCSTVLLIDKKGNALFKERTYDLKDFSYEDVGYEMKILTQ